MRWDPSTNADEFGADEFGTWDGLRLAGAQRDTAPASPLLLTGVLPSRAVLAGPLGPRPRVSSTEPRPSGVFAMTSGIDFPPRTLAISVRTDEPGARAAAIDAARRRGATWAKCWDAADYEIGHWQGLRLRQLARRRTQTEHFIDPCETPA